MHEHDNHRDSWPPLPGAFYECNTQRYVAIIEGCNHSLKRVSRNYNEIILFWQRKRVSVKNEKNDPYQWKNILIYYCVFMIPITFYLKIY